MKRKLILLGSLLLILLFSGCDENSTETGTGLVIKNYNLDPLSKVYKRIPVTMYFWLNNRGNSDAENVKVDFFDLQGFTIDNIDCEGGTSTANGCQIGKIRTIRNLKGESKKVYLQLKAPETNGTRTVSFSVNYDYSGHSELLFNIWQKNVKNQEGSKDTLSTVGPIKITIGSDFLLKRIIDDQEETVTEWVEVDQVFPIKISVQGGKNNKIDQNDFRVKFNYLTPVNEYCDFELHGGYYIPNNDIEVPTKEPLSCVVTADNIDQEWIRASIEVDYDYNYQFIKQQKFNVE